MKKWAVLISAVGLAFAVSGCSSDYVMATKDGRMILTDGKPEIDSVTKEAYKKHVDICLTDFCYPRIHARL